MQSVCFTGACPDMTRDELTEKAEGKFEVKSGVTKDLDIIVCADPNSGSSKLEKAKKNGTKVIGYDEFLKMLDETDDDGEEGLYTHEQSRKILARLREAYGMEAVLIKTRVEKKALPMTASKFGGYPYWEKGAEFPRAESDDEVEAVPLVLLAQINFAEVPPLPDYPTKGLLQIFIRGDDLYGMDYDDQTKQELWRIVWHEDFSEEKAMSKRELRAMGVRSVADADEDDDGLYPLSKEYALSFEKSVSISVPCLDGFEENVKKAAADLGFPLFDESACELFGDNDYTRFYGEKVHHQIGGFPFFTQGDVRRDGDILLFQMDSEMGKGKEICWGDLGVGNFFISREDLRRRDFKKVLYNWDCG